MISLQNIIIITISLFAKAETYAIQYNAWLSIQHSIKNTHTDNIKHIWYIRYEIRI